MIRPIRKAVIPAAGFGTRFLPATKSQPKEMLPIVDTPVIQYVVEELAACQVRDVLMIIGKGKRAIEEHFDRSFLLETQLAEKGDVATLAAMQAISDLADIHFVWQQKMLGLGHAVYGARHHVNDEPFLVSLGDTVIDSPRPACQQLLDVYNRFGASVVLLERVPRQAVSRYGVVDAVEIEPGVFQIRDLVEKPDPEAAPSNLVIASRYVFMPRIFEYLAQIKPGKGGELQLTDAMRLMVKDEPMYGVLLDGQRFDVGNKMGFIRANLAFSLQHEDLAAELRQHIIELADRIR